MLLVMEFVEKGCLRSYLSDLRKKAGRDKQLLHDMQPKLIAFAEQMTEVGSASWCSLLRSVLCQLMCVYTV